MKKVYSIAVVAIIAIALVLIYSINCVDNVVNAESKEDAIEEKMYQKVNVDDNFAEDSIIIVLDKEETFKFREYTPIDFKEIGCKDVKNLMAGTETLVKKQLKARETKDWKELQEYIDNNMLVNLDDYRGILQITLANKGKENVTKAIDYLMKIPGIKTAEPNYVQEMQAEHPIIEDISSQWALKNIDVKTAWDRSTGSSNVLVGVIDTGIDCTHPELQNRIANDLCADFTSGSMVMTPNSIDTAGHGTHVAGIIGAQGVDNRMAGVCWDVRLVSLRVSVDGYDSNTAKISAAVDYATANNIPILNYSADTDGPFSSLLGHKQSLINYPGLFVCAAGNDNNDNDVNPVYPSQYTNESNRIISVSAIDSDNRKRYVANYGATTVDLFAPGGSIFSTWPTQLIESGYKTDGGTSMAVPHVTGVAALMKAYNPLITAEQMKSIIVNNVDYVEALDGLCKSNGKLNAGKVLNATFKTKEIFKWYGYDGDTFFWHGKVNMYYNGDNQVTSSGMVVVKDNSTLDFEVITLDAYNLVYTMNGGMLFNLRNTVGDIYQSNATTVSVNVLSQTTMNNSTFSINTSGLPVGKYVLTMSSHFDRGGMYEQDNVLTYTFGVNKPLKVMDGFGYLATLSYWKGKVDLSNEYLYDYSKDTSGRYIVNKSTTLKFTVGTVSKINTFTSITGTVTMSLVNSSNEVLETHTSNVTVNLVSSVTITSKTFSINTANYSNDTYTIQLSCTMSKGSTTYNNSASYSFVLNKPSSGGSCITTGSLITLADGNQVAVETLTGNEQLLVWDMLNGTFSSAPILFIDTDPTTTYDVIKLSFSDGTQVEVIDEHAFFDVTLNKYVFLRNDASQYIGHFYKKHSYDNEGNIIETQAALVSVNITPMVTTAYSPVTYGHLCYYVNGMLSMPGNTESFINIFEVDPDTMAYDEDSMLQDIATYGLYTYEEFSNIIPLPEIVFDAFNGQYLKVAIGKGITTLEEIQSLLNRYSVFFE